ncbi:hypothetical protein ACFLR1_06160 [Bacteroidota bacterium]
MKSALIFCLSLISVLPGFSQSSLYEFQESDLTDFENIYFSLKEKPIGMAYSFYASLEDCKTDRNKNVLHPGGKYGIETEADPLRNRVFRLEKIVDKSGEDFSSTMYTKANPIFVIRDTISGETIYYRYDKWNVNISKYDYFPFTVTKSGLDEGNLCESIERRKDDFTDVIKLNTPVILSNGLSPVIIYKTIKDDSVKYRLSLNTIGSTANVDGKGATVLFDDGSKLEFETDIEVDVTERGFKYSTYVELTDTQLNTFKSKKVKKFRLYIYDKAVVIDFSDKFLIYVACLIEAE